MRHNPLQTEGQRRKVSSLRSEAARVGPPPKPPPLGLGRSSLRRASTTFGGWSAKIAVTHPQDQRQRGARGDQVLTPDPLPPLPVVRCVFWDEVEEGICRPFAYVRSADCVFPTIRGYSCGNCKAAPLWVRDRGS